MLTALIWGAVAAGIWAVVYLNEKSRRVHYDEQDTSGMIQRAAYHGGKHLWDPKRGPKPQS